MMSSDLKVDRIQLTEESWLDVFQIPEEKFTDLNFEELWDMHPEERGKGIIYGELKEFPRYTQSYGKNYKFTGVENVGEKIPEILEQLKILVDNLGYGDFQQILLNWYKNGHDYIGRHSDDEKQLVPNSAIVSISLGATRKFRIRSKKDKEKVLMDIDLPNGSIVAMCGKFQKELKHEIVKVNGKKGENVGRRINITYRQFK